jgi:1,4-alpha-glucan branching enzyme
MQVVLDDPSLSNFSQAIQDRYNRFLAKLSELEQAEGSIVDFAQSYKDLGFHHTAEGLIYKEWAPGAKALTLSGDFNEWRRWEHVGEKDQYGVWTLRVPNLEGGKCAVPHDSKLKATLVLEND